MKKLEFIIFVLFIMFFANAVLPNASYAQYIGTNPPQDTIPNIPPHGIDDDNPGPILDDDNPGPTLKVTIENPLRGSNTLFSLLKNIINEIVLPIGGVLAVLAFIYSGFLYVVAQGNETKLKTAHKALLYTSIGTAVLLGSWVLANLICSTIGQLGGPGCGI